MIYNNTALSHKNTVRSQEAFNFIETQSLNEIAKSFAVPTNDFQVRTRLRSFGEPITLFGEDKADRRTRLRSVMLARYQKGLPVGDNIDMQMGGENENGEGEGDEDEDMEDEEDEEYYTPGKDELLNARRYIYRKSIAAAQKRIAYQRIIARFPATTHIAFRRKIIAQTLQNIEMFGSQVVSERPASLVRFAPDGKSLGVASWDGVIKIFGVPNMAEDNTIGTIKTLTERPAFDWCPVITSKTKYIAVAGNSGPVYLYNLSESMDSSSRGRPVSKMSGHEQRVARVAFHPTGRFLGSASYDLTWRLWDVETGQELVTQEGHSKEVFTIKFHPDGSLCGTAGLDSIARIWDLRTGRGIMSLSGHVKPIYALDFSPNGYQVATGSADGTIKIWDLREQRQLFTIPAHSAIVSDVKFYSYNNNNSGRSRKRGAMNMIDYEAASRIGEEDTQAQTQFLSESGSFLLSSSYDRTIKIWNSDTWNLVKTLKGHTDKVMSLDVQGGCCSPQVSLGDDNGDDKNKVFKGINNDDDPLYIASSGWDRTVNLWTKDDLY